MELRHHACTIRFDGFHADSELIRDRLIGVTPEKQPQYFFFSLAQFREGVVVRRRDDRRMLGIGCLSEVDKEFSVDDRSHRIEQIDIGDRFNDVSVGSASKHLSDDFAVVMHRYDENFNICVLVADVRDRLRRFSAGHGKIEEDQVWTQ